MNTDNIIIHTDGTRNCTLRPPEYNLSHEYRQRYNGKMRTFRDRLFSSSKLEKIINYINENL